MTVKRIEPPAPPIGVIDSIASGFEIVADKLYLALLPVLLDLMLWAGPRMNVKPAFESFYLNFTALADSQPATPELQEQFVVFTQWFEALIGEIELQYLVASNWPLGDLLLVGVPSLSSRQAVTELPFSFQPPIIIVRSMLGMVALTLALPLAWSVMGVLYRALLAQQIRDERLIIGALLRRFPFYWLNLIAFLVGLALLALVVMTPFVVVGSLFASLSVAIGSMVILVGVLMLLWVGIFGSFTVHGVLLKAQWLPRAAYDSFRIVRRNLTSVTLLWLLIIGFNEGLSSLFSWAGLTTESWFIILAFGVYAFVNTGLMSASYAYYNDQHRYWHEMRELVLQIAANSKSDEVQDESR